MARKPDLVHVSSVIEGFHGHAVVPSLRGIPQGTVLSATVYDVIPLLFADVYLADVATRSWYLNRLDCLRQCDLLLAISESTRKDAIEHLRLSPDQVVNIHAGVDDCFTPGVPTPQRRHETLARLGITKPFVMYTGGIDHRKNVESLIRAYASLPPTLSGKPAARALRHRQNNYRHA